MQKRVAFQFVLNFPKQEIKISNETKGFFWDTTVVRNNLLFIID